MVKQWAFITSTKIQIPKKYVSHHMGHLAHASKPSHLHKQDFMQMVLGAKIGCIGHSKFPSRDFSTKGVIRGLQASYIAL